MNIKSTQTAKQNAAAAGGKINHGILLPAGRVLLANRANEKREDKCRLAARHSHVETLSFAMMREIGLNKSQESQ